jgi:hypothetical protein
MLQPVQHAPQPTVLTALGASPAESGELLAYCGNPYQDAALAAPGRLPLADEPLVAFWERCAADAAARGCFAALRERLPQLCFPIREGISDSVAYRAATRRGVPPAELAADATGLELQQPETLEIVLHPSAAGRIPLIVTRCRHDFESLVRALTRRNEPSPVPAAMGAQMVAGYNNWARLAELRQAWEATPPGRRVAASWSAEMERLQQDGKDLYQDRFILLSDGPYSGVPAAAVGEGEARWRELSLAIRREHECTHYFTRRLFGAMRNNLLDELIADYVGVASAAGSLRPDWLLRFLGLEEAPRFRSGGRLEIYRVNPPHSPLSDPAFAVLQRLAVAAIANLAGFDDRHRPALSTPLDRGLLITALATLRLDDLAAATGPALMGAAYERARRDAHRAASMAEEG